MEESHTEMDKLLLLIGGSVCSYFRLKSWFIELDLLLSSNLVCSREGISILLLEIFTTFDERREAGWVDSDCTVGRNVYFG